MKLTQQQAIILQLALVAEALEIMTKKRHDYSGTSDPFRNFRASSVIAIPPWQGVLIRLLDKLSRIFSVLEKRGKCEVENETLTDTLADIVNYAAILDGLICEDSLTDQPKAREQFFADKRKKAFELLGLVERLLGL